MPEITQEQLKDWGTSLVNETNVLKEAEYAKKDEERDAKFIQTLTEREAAITAEFKAAIDAITANVERKLATDAGEPDETALPHKFKSFGHFCHDLVKAGPDGREASEELITWNKTVHEYRIENKATIAAGNAETGGSLIPTEFSNQVLERVKAKSSIMQNAMIIPMGSNRIVIPLIAGFDESQGVVDGNVRWYWKGEEVVGVASNFETGAVALTLQKCIGMAKVTDEIIRWSPQSIEALVQRSFETGLNMAVNKACLRGTGAGQPRGVIGAPCTIAVPKETSQLADTFIYDNVLAMIARQYSSDEGLGDGNWYANKTVFPQIGLLSLPVGTGGSGIFLAGQSIQGKPNLTIMGMPLLFSSQMSAVGDAGDIGLFDWKQYLIGQPAGGAGMETEQSIHLYFDYGCTAFRFLFYMDGQPWWPDEFTPLHGDSQSPFVTLAARA